MSTSSTRSDPPSPRRTAHRILLRVDRERAYASVLLDRAESGFADPRDAALLHEVVLGVLRTRSALDHALSRVVRRSLRTLDREVLTALRIGAYSLHRLDRVPDFAAVDSAVDLVKSGPRAAAAGFVNGVLRSLARRGRDALPAPPREGDVAGLALYHSHPEWWVGERVRRFGWEATARLLAADNRPAPAVLHANLRRGGVAELEAELRRDGVEAERCRFAPAALRLPRGRLAGLLPLVEGRAWVQDEASQLVPLLFGERLGPRVIDLCAAPGGKTMQLAEAMPPARPVIAVDRHPSRVRRLLENARGKGFHRVLAVVADMSGGPGPIAAEFDQVLVDAPCTGTGTLRRRPEIRWRLGKDDPRRLARVQLRLLSSASGLVAPGGSLVYSVCSLEAEEGESVVERFLRRHPGFRAEDAGPRLPKAARTLVTEGGFLRTSPDIGGLDGFFAALLVRRR